MNNNRKIYNSSEYRINPGYFSECRWRKITASEAYLYQDNNFYVELDFNNKLKLKQVYFLNNYRTNRENKYLIRVGKDLVSIDINQFIFIEPKKVDIEENRESFDEEN